MPRLDSIRIAQPQATSNAEHYTKVLADIITPRHPLLNNAHAHKAAIRHCYRLASEAMHGYPEYTRPQAVEAALDLQRRRINMLDGFDRMASQMEKRRDVCTRHLSPWIWRHAADDEEKVRDQAEAWHKLLTEASNNGASRLYESHKSIILDYIGADKEPKRGITQKWLRRRLRFAIRQAQESTHLLFGEIGASGDAYASDWTTQNRQNQVDTQLRWMQCTTVNNTENGEESFKLSDIARNAKMKLAEALAITHALEKIGKERDYSMQFITLTLPSEYHPNPQYGNNSWDGHNPSDGQKWINKRWARVRASMKKKGIGNLYVRTTEPHKDSSPHWHVMIWSDDSEETKRLIFKHFRHSDDAVKIKDLSYKEDGDEEKASATSYILKYIVKTLPGDDSIKQFGDTKETGRIDAWRATYGIRALQYGGLPRGAVTAWRESRRAAIEKGMIIPIEAVEMLTAAKNNDFQIFIEEMEYLRVTLLKVRDLWTDEEKEERGHDEGQQVIGIKNPDWIINTHQKAWKLEFDAKAFYENINKINAVTVIHNYPSEGTDQTAEGGKAQKSRNDRHESPPETAPPGRMAMRRPH